MQPPTQTIDHGSLRRLIEAGAPVGAEVVGVGGSWGVLIRYGRSSQTLAATRGKPKTFRQFETLASYLKELGIVEYRVNAAAFDAAKPKQAKPDRRSQLASERMKRAHEAAAYDQWLREQVQASLEDERSSLDDEQARAQMAARRQALLAKRQARPAPATRSRKAAT